MDSTISCIPLISITFLLLWSKINLKSTNLHYNNLHIILCPLYLINFNSGQKYNQDMSAFVKCVVNLMQCWCVTNSHMIKLLFLSVLKVTVVAKRIRTSCYVISDKKNKYEWNGQTITKNTVTFVPEIQYVYSKFGFCNAEKHFKNFRHALW